VKFMNNTFFLNPTEINDIGVYPIDLRISDGYSKDVSFNFTIKVEPKRPKSLFVQRA